MEIELCCPCFDSGETTLFLAVQHPAETNGTHQRGSDEFQAHTLQSSDGKLIKQLRQLLLSPNLFSRVPGRPPRPSLVTIRGHDGTPLLD